MLAQQKVSVETGLRPPAVDASKDVAKDASLR
jgi:hypothetical protein